MRSRRNAKNWKARKRRSNDASTRSTRRAPSSPIEMPVFTTRSSSSSRNTGRFARSSLVFRLRRRTLADIVKYSPKSFLLRPEGKLGVVITAAAGAVGLVALYRALPVLITFATDVLHLGVLCGA